ncbi:MAG: SAM-dependent methyltransferase [Promethearchaeota archaeon]
MEFWMNVLVVVLVFLAMSIWVAWSAIFGAPWVPTPRKKVRGMLEMAEVSPEDLLYDIGSGDGRILIMAAKEFGARCVGIELDPLRVLWSRLAIRRWGLSQRVLVLRENFFSSPIEHATVVTVYQGVGVNERLEEKFSRELRPGTRVVSYRFLFKGLTQVKADEKNSTYLYII